MKKTGFWLILIGGLLALSLIAAVLLRQNAESGTAKIWQEGVLLETIDLDRVTEPYTVTVSAKEGGVNVISVERGRIRVIEADCPDGVCVDQGWISDSSAPIACLPHGLIIEITGVNSDVDGVT